MPLIWKKKEFLTAATNALPSRSLTILYYCWWRVEIKLDLSFCFSFWWFHLYSNGNGIGSRSPWPVSHEWAGWKGIFLLLFLLCLWIFEVIHLSLLWSLHLIQSNEQSNLIFFHVLITFACHDQHALLPALSSMLLACCTKIGATATLLVKKKQSLEIADFISV